MDRRYLVSRYAEMPGSPALDTNYTWLVARSIGDRVESVTLDLEEASGSGKDPLGIRMALLLDDDRFEEEQLLFQDTIRSQYWGSIRLDLANRRLSPEGLLKLRLNFYEGTLADLAGMLVTASFYAEGVGDGS